MISSALFADRYSVGNVMRENISGLEKDTPPRTSEPPTRLKYRQSSLIQFDVAVRQSSDVIDMVICL